MITERWFQTITTKLDRRAPLKRLSIGTAAIFGGRTGAPGTASPVSAAPIPSPAASPQATPSSCQLTLANGTMPPHESAVGYYYGNGQMRTQLWPNGTADIPKGYGDTGFVPTGLYFPTPGCWEVTAAAGSASLTFVTRVVKTDEPWQVSATPSPTSAS